MPRRTEPTGPLPPRIIHTATRRAPAHTQFGADLRNHNQIVKIVGMLLALSAPAWIIALLFTWEGFDYVLPLFAIPVLLIPVALLILRVSREDPLLRMIMFVTLAAKLAACGAFMYLAFHVYNQSADALHYSDEAEQLVRGFLSFGQPPVLYPFWSTNFIVMLVSWIYIAIGVSFQAVTVLFAVAGFWGQFFLYKAFRTVFPAQQPYTYGMLIFLLPSIVFWSSPAGKDAIIFLGVGLACYGFALMSRHAGVRGYILVAAGLATCLLVRPHIALLLALSMVIPFLVGEHLTGTGGMILKVISLPLFAFGLYYLASQASMFLDVRDFGQTRDLVSKVSQANAIGGSSVGQGSIASRLLLGPFLMFRPFPWEVRSAQAAIASLEGMGLAAYCFRRRQDVKASLRLWRKNSFITFILCYSVGFTVVFSAAMTNLGLLSRQRIMMVPVALMIFAGSSRVIERGAPVPARFMVKRTILRAPAARPNGY